MFLKLLPIVFICVISLGSFAQNDSGRVRVFTKPSKSIIKIEHQTIKYGQFYLLDSGTYNLKAWSEGMNILEKKVNISKDDILSIRMKLEPTKEYKVYSAQLRNYRIKKFSLEKLPTYFLVAFTTYRVFGISSDIIKRKKHLNKANEFEKKYNNSFWFEDITLNREGFEENKKKYKEDNENISKKTTSYLIGAGATVFAIYYGKKFAKKLVKPTFSEKPKMTASFFPVFNKNYSGLHMYLTF